MEWRDVGKVAASVAPILAGVLGGPVGAIAGAAGALVGSFLGVEATPDAVSAALRNPETLVRLKELENRQQERLLEWQTALMQAELADRQGARDREIALARAGHGASWGTTVVAIIVSLSFFVMMYVVLSGELRSTPLGETASMLLGTLAAAFVQVINYYLGSSSGSAAKSRDMVALTARNGGRNGLE